MEGHTKVKNIFILLLFFVMGFLSNIFLTHWKDIDIYELLKELEGDTVVEQIATTDVKSAVCEANVEIVEETEIDPCPVLVDISGAVSTPGVYCFEKGSAVMDAVKKAKGFTPDAGYKYISMKINLATAMLDNSKIYIPFEQDYDCELLNFSLPKEVVDITIPNTEPEEDDTQDTTECVSINSATQTQLETLVGVGPSTALKIIEGRPYTKLEDLLDVSGIGDATFNKFKDDICL